MAEVKKRLKTDPRAFWRQRWLIIYHALVEPRKAEEMARHCGVSKATVHEVIASDNRLGGGAVETVGKGGRRRQYLTLEEEKEFLAPFFAQAQTGEIAPVGQIWRAFEKRVGHEGDDCTIYRLLNRHGWRKLMPRPRHPKADPQAQEQFKKNFPTQVEAAMATREVGNERPVLIMAQDEGCFGRISQPRRCWAPPGVRPQVPAQLVREYVPAYAAVAPALGHMVSLILPETSTAMMNLFLAQVSQTFPNHFMVMQIDRAGWHRSQELVMPANMRLIPQPASSPEVNPVEHVWEELREKYCYTHIFSSLDALIDRLCQGLTDLADDVGRLRSLPSFPHLTVLL